MPAYPQDLRYSVRMLLKSPGFTLVVVLTLALGIGANTAIFSVINSVLLRPLPFHQPDRLVYLRVTEASPGDYPLTGPDYLDWQSRNHTFEATSLYSWSGTANMSSTGQAASATLVHAQANFFETLGVEPRIGRSFAAGEDLQGRNHVAILSYGFWQQHFAGRAGAVGEAITLDSQSYTIIGVMPASFNFPSATDIWTPMDMTPKALGQRGSHSYRAIARLKPGVALSEARADLTMICKQLAKQFPDSDGDALPVVRPLKEVLTASSQPELLILFGAVALVLVVACVNVANLLLARATERQREMAIRQAMGASRGRLIRQLLTESLLLSSMGAVVGLLGAVWLVGYVRTSNRIPIPRENPVQLDLTVLLFTVGLTLLVGILFGLAPALQTTHLSPNDDLKFSAAPVLNAAGGRSLRDALVIGEVAISLALLVGAGLLLRSFGRMRNADIGVHTENVITMGLNLPETKYADLRSRRSFYDQLLVRTSRLPGVQMAAISTTLPLEGGTNGYVTVPGDTNPAHASQLVEWAYITPDYFDVMGIPFLEGRNLNSQDAEHAAEASAQVLKLVQSGKSPDALPPGLGLPAVINRAMAQTFWPNQDPIGKVFKNFLPMTVVGVVEDVKEWGIREKAIPQAYMPLSAALAFVGFSHVVVRTAVDPETVLAPIRRELADLDATLALSRPRTIRQVISDNMQDTNAQTLLLSVFAGLGLILAAVGIYGVMAYLVTQRTQEIGVRMALGAQQSDVLRLVLSHGVKLTVSGIALGTAAALGLMQLLRALLFGVGARDPLTFGMVALLLAVVALAACYIPARRAARVDPMIALRYE
jgi:putative ABC transport system permease protein